MLKRLAALIATLIVLSPVAAMAADASLSAEANAAFLAQNARQKGVIVRPSGLQYKIFQNGSGKHPGPTDHVTVYYTGSLINGNVFDGTEPGFPVVFTANTLIKGWSEALQLMREGDHWQLVIPSQLGYGSRGAGDGQIPPNQTLVFDLQLLSVSGPTKEEQAHEAEQQQEDQDKHPGPGAE